MIGVDEIDGLVIMRARRIEAVAVHRVEAAEQHIAGLRLRARRAPAAAAAARPVHWPMALQPSTQSCRVICVRDGRARSSASEISNGVRDEAADLQAIAGELLGGERLIVGLAGVGACRWRRSWRKSRSPEIPRASVCGVSSRRCTNFVASSPACRAFCPVRVAAKRLQPPSATGAAEPEAAEEKAAAIQDFAFHDASLSARTANQPVIMPRNWLNGPVSSTIARWTTTNSTSSVAMTKWAVRALCRPPNASGKPGRDGVEARRHRQPRQDLQRQQDQNDDEIGELLEHVIARRLLALGEAQGQMLAQRGADAAQFRRPSESGGGATGRRAARRRDRRGR